MAITERFKSAWNAFVGRDPTKTVKWDTGPGYYLRPDRIRLTRGNEKSLINSVYTRLALDVSSLSIEHCKLDKNGVYEKRIKSGFNYCVSTEANIDQTGRQLLQDICMSMFDEGVVAVVPVDTTDSPDYTDSYEIETMRTGKILEWYPKFVKVRLYNDRTGKHEELVLPKTDVAVIENPYFSVMNEPNSTVQRLIRKMNHMDIIDEQNGNGKLNLIVQLPYIVKTEARKKQAEARRVELENQLGESKYGIAYTDGTEHITQLNRSIENNLLSEVEYLTNLFYSQLGITAEIMNGSADPNVMENYYSRTIEPIISAIVLEFNRKFLTKTARSQGHVIQFYRDPFKLMPVSNIADIADKFTRNEIMSSNEIRQKVGLKPVKNEKADELRNKNISQSEGQEFTTTEGDTIKTGIQNVNKLGDEDSETV